MKVVFNVKCRAAGNSYAAGDEADIDDATARQLFKLTRNGTPFASEVKAEPAAEPKPKTKAKAKRKAKPKAKAKRETATQG